MVYSKMNKNGAVVLLYPPPSNPEQPYSSLPTLTAFLRNSGIQVIQKDIGIEVFNELLTPEMLSKSRDRALTIANSKNWITKKDYYKEFFYTIGFSDYVISHITKAKQIMHDEKLFYDIKLYKWAVSIIKLACDLVSLPYYPSKFQPGDYNLNFDLTLEGLSKAIINENENLFLKIFEKEIAPQILLMKPLLVGISVTYPSQIVPAFTLSKILKSSAPHLHINIGGAVINHMKDSILENPLFFQFADSFTIGEGETALLTLTQCLQECRELENVPNLITKINGKPYFYNLHWHENINELPCPDFDGLDLKRYFSPEPVLLLSTARGCYYGKCAFCDVSKNTRNIYRKMEDSQIINNLRNLNKKYNVKRFFFSDDTMPPENMLLVAGLVKNELNEVTWQSETRFEKILTPEFISNLKEGGCRQLIFGLESASQRVLDMMNKGSSIKNSIMIIESCFNNGISINLQTFIGFPTEIYEEAMETVDFLISNENKISSIGFGKFDLCKNTPVYNESSKYGIKNITIDNEIMNYCNFEYSSDKDSYDIEREHELAKRKLEKIYSTRSEYLGTASGIGAHSLLYFSHYDYNELYQIWEDIDRNHYPDGKDLLEIGEKLLSISPSLIFSFDSDAEHSFNHRLLCTRSGEVYEISIAGQKLLELCDGSKMNDIVSKWVKDQDNGQGLQIIHLSRAYALINEFLRKGLVAVDKYSN